MARDIVKAITSASPDGGVTETGCASLGTAAWVIYGRSDTTINRYGIRMGTSEFNRVVEGFDEIGDSLVLDLEYLGQESYLPLFVVLNESQALTDDLTTRLNNAIRRELSARHLPNDIIAVPSIPRTLTSCSAWKSVLSPTPMRWWIPKAFWCSRRLQKSVIVKRRVKRVQFDESNGAARLRASVVS